MKSQKRYSVTGLVVILSVLSLISGCGSPVGGDPGGNGADDSVTVSGSVSGSSIQGASLSTTGGGGELFIRVFQAPSVPGLTGVDSDQYWRTINEARDYAVDDGQFEFDVDDGDAFVAVLMQRLNGDDENAVGVIGIGTGAEEHWHAVDTSLVDGEEIDLGEIDLDSELDLTLAAENDVHSIGSSVSEHMATIASLARFDDAVRVLVNVANSGAEAYPSFRFLSEETFSDLAGDPGTEGTSKPAEYKYMGYRFVYIPVDVPDYDYLSLYPPEGETVQVVDLGESDDKPTIDNNNPLYARPRDPDDDDYYYKFSTTDELENPDILAGFYLLDDVPPLGAWSARLASGEEFTKLYFGMYPPITEDGELQLPIPRVSVTTDDEGYLTHISVQWVLWDGSDYVEIDPEVVEPFISWGGIDMQGYATIDGKKTRVDSGDWVRADTVWDTEFTIEAEGYIDRKLEVEERWFLPGVAESDPDGIEVDLIRPAFHFCGFYVELFHQPGLLY